MNKSVLIFSGGMDSTTLLYHLLAQGHEVKCLLFDYGQRHVKELDAAVDICMELKPQVTWQIADLADIRPLLRKGSQSGSSPVPEGHYAEESMKTTIVPNRNMIMLSIAAGHAVAIGSDNLYYAAHAGDHAIYPDCRPEFVMSMSRTLAIANAWTPVYLEAPFIHKTKAMIVQMGLELKVPYEKTWTCYKGGLKACGKCGTCVERLEAFYLNGVEDPLEYEDREWWKTCKKG